MNDDQKEGKQKVSSLLADRPPIVIKQEKAKEFLDKKADPQIVDMHRLRAERMARNRKKKD